MKQPAFALLQRIKERSNKTPNAGEEGKAEVTAIYPAIGIAAEELLCVAASAHRFALEPFSEAIIRRAKGLDLLVPDPEDFRYLPSGGIHCWVRGIPTLVGSKGFLTRLGIDVSDASHNAAVATEIFVAQGKHCLGYIQIDRVATPPK